MVANLLTHRFGPKMSIINAFLFIGLDLTSRDKLHELWYKRALFPKMMALIITGSIISYLLNRASYRISIASTVAFMSAGLIDYIIYSLLHEKARIFKVNGSNVGSSLVDSVIFPTIAFGQLMPVIILGQFAAKVGGGFVWSLILFKKIPVSNK